MISAPIHWREAVTKNEKTIVFSINKTTQAVPFTFKKNGSTYTDSSQHETLSFPELNKLRTFDLDEPVLTEVLPKNTANPCVVLLPPLSLNRIDLVE